MLKLGWSCSLRLQSRINCWNITQSAFYPFPFCCFLLIFCATNTYFYSFPLQHIYLSHNLIMFLTEFWYPLPLAFYSSLSGMDINNPFLPYHLLLKFYVAQPALRANPVVFHPVFPWCVFLLLVKQFSVLLYRITLYDYQAMCRTNKESTDSAHSLLDVSIVNIMSTPH